MRRKDREIADFDAIVDIIRRCEVCRVAFFDDEYPYIVPMNYGVKADDGKISLFFHCAKQGKKLDLLAKNNKVCFEVDCDRMLVFKDKNVACSYGYAYTSVVGEGVMSVLPEESKLEGLAAIMEKFGVTDYEFDKTRVEQVNVLRLDVLHVSGKSRPLPTKSQP